MADNKEKWRHNVGERVCKEWDRYSEKVMGLSKRSTFEAMAKEVGMSKQTFFNIASGIGSITLENLGLIADTTGCDIRYLYGDIDNRIYVSDDIQSSIGLEESAIETLVQMKRNPRHSEDEDKLFYSFLTKIINDYYMGDPEDIFVKTTYGSKPGNGEFPIWKIISYIKNTRIANQIGGSELYALAKSLREQFINDNGEEPAPIRVRETISNLGYDGAEAWSNMIKYDTFTNRDKRIERFFIQEDMTRFLDSDFVEGK